MEFDITGNNDGASRLTIDLKHFLTMYHNGTDSEYLQAYNEIRDIVRDYEGAIIFNYLADSANVPDYLRDSPAYKHMTNQFSEVLKNSIDIKLQEQEAGLLPDDCTLELDVNFMDFNDGNNDLLRISIADNGSGIPEETLNKIGDKQSREQSNYYDQVGSKKRITGGSNRRLYFGGAGRGTRELMGLFDQGDRYFTNDVTKISCTQQTNSLIDDRANKQTYVVPEVSELAFYNKPGPYSGAVVEVTTTQAPLIVNAQMETEAPIMDLSKKKFGKGIAQRAKPSSVTRESPVSVVDDPSENLDNSSHASASNIFKQNFKNILSEANDDEDTSYEIRKGMDFGS